MYHVRYNGSDLAVVPTEVPLFHSHAPHAAPMIPKSLTPVYNGGDNDELSNILPVVVSFSRFQFVRIVLTMMPSLEVEIWIS